MIASEAGVAVTYGLNNAQQRGQTFIEPGTPVYEGMIVGLNARPEISRSTSARRRRRPISAPRPQTSPCASRPAVNLSLEQSLDFINNDELVEVTPQSVRLRKRLLTQHDRARAREVEQSGAR